jgi:hypothetical protein
MAKYSYEITIPDKGTFVIDSDKEMSDAQAYQAVMQSGNAPEQRTAVQDIVRGAGITARGLAPVALGAGAGALLGGPPGALVGSFTVPAAEIASRAANVILPESMQIPSPSGTIQNFLTQAGLPVPETTSERAMQAAAEAVGATGTQVATAPAMAQRAITGLGKGIAESIGSQPVRQIAAAAPSAVASQVVGERFGTIPGMFAGMAASAPFAIGAKPTQQDYVPSTQDLKQTAGRLYDIADKSGVRFKTNEFSTFAAKTINELRKEGVDPTLTPKANAALQRIQDSVNEPMTLSNVDRLRKIALIAATSNDPADRTFGGKLIERIDSFVENSGPSQFAVSDPKAIEALKEARSLWKQGKKAQVLETIFDVAELRAEANYTQSGMEQALRSRLVNLAANEKLMRSFNKTEQAAIREAAKGGKLQNFMRYVGKLAPTSVIPAVGGAYLGSQMFGPTGTLAGAIPAVVGAGAKTIATKMGIGNFKRLEDMLKLGREPRTPVSGVSPIIMRGLLSSPNQQLDVTEEQLQQIYGR